MKKIELFNEWININNETKNDIPRHICVERLLNFVCLQHEEDPTSISEEYSSKIKSTLDALVQRFSYWWKDCGRGRQKAVKKYSKQLNEDLEFVFKEETPNTPSSQIQFDTFSTPATSSGRGRHRSGSEFSELSLATKYRRTESPVSKYSNEQLKFATMRKLHASGKHSVAKVLELADSSPTKAGKILQTSKSQDCEAKPRRLTPEEAVANIIRTGKTVASYKEDRKTYLEVGHDVLPPIIMCLNIKSTHTQNLKPSQ